MSDAASKPDRRNVVVRYLARFDDGEVLRWAFRGLLVGAIGVLVMDLRDMNAVSRAAEPVAPDLPRFAEPVLPPAVKDDESGNETTDPREDVTADDETLRQAAEFALRPGGVLTVTGTIDPGASERFAAELDERGEYVKTVALNSPGGALEDAMAMAALIRDRKLATHVPDGAICASSCPLILAGGVARTAGAKAAVGLHQFYASTVEGLAPAQAMSDAQATTARITRHLEAMGVDPALWLHALDTPPRQLYYLSAKELASYRLTTAKVPAVATSG